MIKNQKMIGNLLLTLTALIWGMAFVFQRKGMESIEPITFTSARMALAAVAVGIAAFIYTKKPVAKTTEEDKKKQRKKIKKMKEDAFRFETVNTFGWIKDSKPAAKPRKIK